MTGRLKGITKIDNKNCLNFVQLRVFEPLWQVNLQLLNLSKQQRL